jgi:toxin YhaV
MLTIKGWLIYGHPLLLEQVERLTAAVEKERTRDPRNYLRSANTKLLAGIYKLAFEQIPDDPSLPIYRQGETLGADRKHWFRAKFGGQRFRLYFRYRANPNIILYVWVNDRDTVRQYGAKTDAYAIFQSMLAKGHPPDRWDALIDACRSAEAEARLANFEKDAVKSKDAD